ncbi:uncharacterized protein LOC126176098, partial [Schistocerca cancellata]
PPLCVSFSVSPVPISVVSLFLSPVPPSVSP